VRVFVGKRCERETLLSPLLVVQVREAELTLAKYDVESYGNCACRFLRARKFDVPRALALLSEAVRTRNEHRPWDVIAMGAERATGCNLILIKAFYPHAAYGFDRFNRPVFYERTGIVNATALATITTMDGLIKYHWISMDKVLGDAFKEVGVTNLSQELTSKCNRRRAEGL
jgi:hypothetical protein